MYHVLFEIYYFATECEPSETHFEIFECDKFEQIEEHKQELKKRYPTAFISIVDNIL